MYPRKTAHSSREATFPLEGASRLLYLTPLPRRNPAHPGSRHLATFVPNRKEDTHADPKPCVRAVDERGPRRCACQDRRDPKHAQFSRPSHSRRGPRALQGRKRLPAGGGKGLRRLRRASRDLAACLRPRGISPRRGTSACAAPRAAESGPAKRCRQRHHDRRRQRCLVRVYGDLRCHEAFQWQGSRHGRAPGRHFQLLPPFASQHRYASLIV